MNYTKALMMRGRSTQLFAHRRRLLHSSRILSSTASTEESKCDGVKMERNQEEECDVAIVGGGMVGLAIASALSSMPLTKHLRVSIVDDPFLASRDYFRKDEMLCSGVSSVTPATINLFKEVGAWEHVLHQTHTFFDQIEVWEYTLLRCIEFNAMGMGKEYLGCVVENQVLHNSLLLALQKKEGFENMIYSTRLASLTLPSEGSSTKEQEINQSKCAKLYLTDGKTLHAKLVVVADCCKSDAAKAAGITTAGWNHSQSAVICTVDHSPMEYCAWQRFPGSGRIRLRLIGDIYTNLVWTMSPEQTSQPKPDPNENIKSMKKALDSVYGPAQSLAA